MDALLAALGDEVADAFEGSLSEPFCCCLDRSAG